MGITIRISAHSVREGSAADALLNGVPLVIIKAWRGWKQVDTLEPYLGKIIREQVPVLGYMTKVAH